MKELTILDVPYCNVYYNEITHKIEIIKTRNNPYTCLSDDVPNDDNLTCLFSINPVLIGMLKTLSIPFNKAKNRIVSAIKKDLKTTGNNLFGKNSNLYNLLVNEFGLKNLKFK